MATKLYFRSDVYNSVKAFPTQQPARSAPVPSTTAAGASSGTGIYLTATTTFGVVGHDLAYNPTTGRWLIVGDNGGSALFGTYVAWADNIEGPWTVSTGVFSNSSAYCIIGCVYAFGKFFIQDDTNGVIWSSPTGETGTWTLAFTPPIAGPGRTIQFVNDRIIACMNGPAICWTADGTTWTQTTLPGGTGICYGADYSASQGRWVLTGDNATVWWATTWGTWTRVNLQGQTNNTRGILWSSRLGLWIVCGNNGFIATTTDPTGSNTWTTRTSGSTQILMHIVEYDNTLVICGDLKTVSRSTDGVTWTTVQHNTDNSDFWQHRVFNNTLYLIGERSPNLLWGTDDYGATLKLYASHKSRRVNQPGNLTSSGKPVMTEEALQLRTLSTTIGTGQVSSFITSIAATTFQTALLGIFATNPIANDSITIGAGSIILNAADATSNATRLLFNTNSVNIYVWRPSTNTLVGYILDAAGFDLSTGAPKAVSTTETVTHITGILGSPVTALEGDILVVEVWSSFTPTVTTSYTGTWYYNGTTENATQGSSVANHASYIQFTEDITFKTGRANFHSYTSV